MTSPKGFAAFFNVPLEDVLGMAGHLAPARPEPYSPEMVALIREDKRLPRPLQRAVIKALGAVLESIQAEREPSGR